MTPVSFGLSRAAKIVARGARACRRASPRLTPRDADPLWSRKQAAIRAYAALAKSLRPALEPALAGALAADR